MESLPIPPKESLVFEDDRLYVCLASFPITRGHTVVVWKNHISDLHLLAHEEYEYLMDMVDIARNALLNLLGVDKVYLMYMDEIKQVHWHLVPRYDEQGVNMLAHVPVETKDFALAEPLRATFQSTANVL